MKAFLNFLTCFCILMRIFQSVDSLATPVTSSFFAPESAITENGNWAQTCASAPPDFLRNMPVSLFHVVFHSSRVHPCDSVISHLNKSTSTHLSLLLLLLSGDVNINPGPEYQPKYPCGVCGKAVKWKQQAIECEECSIWYHKQCIEMSDNIFEVLEAHPSYSWICINCGLPNLALSFFDSSFELSNSFDPLSPLNSSGSQDDPRWINHKGMSIVHQAPNVNFFHPGVRGKRRVKPNP